MYVTLTITHISLRTAIYARTQDGGHGAWAAGHSAAALGLSPSAAAADSSGASSGASGGASPFPLPSAMRASAGSKSAMAAAAAAAVAAREGDNSDRAVTGEGQLAGGAGRSNWVSQFCAAAGARDGAPTGAGMAGGSSNSGGGGDGGGDGGADPFQAGDALAVSPPHPLPAFGEFPPLSGAAAGTAGSRAAVKTVGAAAGAGAAAGTARGSGNGAAGADGASARVTAPSTPLTPAAAVAAAAAAAATAGTVDSSGAGSLLPVTPTGTLKVGDSVEAQFLLADQAVWTTSWYRGKVSHVTRTAAGGGGGRVTYGVAFADGDRLEEVPELRIRLFRGLRVGSVVSVEWPDKGGDPFKGCLTKVCHGDGTGAPTVSVIFEDTDTEVCCWCSVVVIFCCCAFDVETFDVPLCGVGAAAVAVCW